MELTLQQLPEDIRKLVEHRNNYRKARNFKRSDLIRKELAQKGYLLTDEGNITRIYRIEKDAHPKQNFIVLFGSGEISSTGRKIHEEVLQRIGKDPVKIGIVTTPAGFQPNVTVVYEEIAQFFRDHLKNFHPEITIISANTKKEANDESIVNRLNDVDYIFTGPGSPTYALNHMRNTLLLQKIIDRVRAGASLALSSAATLSFSHYVLPVYEIYKVGADPYWEAGLDVLSEFFEEITVIPHFNNNEGGEKTDTSRCFMGSERFAKLRAMLPPQEKVWGIDEHSAAIIDVATKEVSQRGKGTVHFTV
jgi:cyanophycinase-like exopeptidase